MAPITILGAGSWGTALAIHLGRLGTSTRLWGRDEVLIKHLEDARENARYLPGVQVPAAVRATQDQRQALADSRIVIVAVPSQFAEEVIESARHAIPTDAILVSATKGLEPRRGRRISVLLSEMLPGSANEWWMRLARRATRRPLSGR